MRKKNHIDYSCERSILWKKIRFNLLVVGFFSLCAGSLPVLSLKHLQKLVLPFHQRAFWYPEKYKNRRVRDLTEQTNSSFEACEVSGCSSNIICWPVTGQASEVVTNPHLSLSHQVVASWVVIGQNQNLLLFLCASLGETGQSLKPLSLQASYVEVTGQSQNHAFSEVSSEVEADEDQVSVSS